MDMLNDIKITKINGREFVSGLMWQPLQRQRAHMAEARDIGKKFGMDIVAIRPSATMIQAGFVKKGNGVNKGMYSMASALAGNIHEESWIGVFELPDGDYALIAVHGGLIVPGCDVVGSKQDIRNLLIEKDSQRKVISFGKVFHPLDFDYRGEPLDLADLLHPKQLKAEFKLKQLTFGMTKKELIVVGCLALAIVAAGLGYLQWSAYQEQLERQEADRQELLRQQQLAELAAKSASSPESQALLHPWATMPGIADFLSGCQGGIDALPLALGGWLFESAICTSETLETVYSRAPSATFETFAAAAATRFPSPPALLDGGERAGLGDQITLGAGGDDELLLVDDMRAQFTSYLQRLELKAEIVEVAPPAPPVAEQLPGQAEPAAPPPPAWKKFGFTVTTQHTPETVFRGFALQGVRLTEISVNKADVQLTWSIKGEIYAR